MYQRRERLYIQLYIDIKSPNNELIYTSIHNFFFVYCDALRDLVPFVQFKKREKYPLRSVTFSKACNFTKSNIPPWEFFTFF